MLRRLSVMRGVLLAALTAMVACDDSVTTTASRPGAGSGPSRVTTLGGAVQGVANSPLRDVGPTVSYPWLAWDQEIATPTGSDPDLTTFQVALQNVESGATRTYASAAGAGANARNSVVSGSTLVFVSWDPATQRWLLEAVDVAANTRRTVLSLGASVDGLDLDGQLVVWSGTNSQGAAGVHLVDLGTSTGSTLYAAGAGETVTNPRISGNRVLFQIGRNIQLYDANTRAGGMILGGADASDIDGSRIVYAERLSTGMTYYWMFDLATGEQRQVAQMWSNTPIVRAAADRIAFSGTLDPYGDHVFVYDVGTQELFQVDQTLSSQAVWGFDSRLVAWSDGRNATVGNALDVFYQTIGGTPVNGIPTVDAGGPYAGAEGGGITFTATASDPDGDVLQYLWTIAGISFNQPSVTRTFGRSGTYDASVQVSDSRGGTATANVQVTIANEPPTIDSVAVMPQAQVGQAVSLAATIADPGTQDSPWRFTIAWGDGTTSSGQIDNLATPIGGSHAYAAAGNYTVTLTVSDPDGASATAARAVTVAVPAGNTQPGANVTVSPDETNGGGQPVTITFSAVASAGNTTVTAYPIRDRFPGSIVTPLKGSAYRIETTARYTGPITVCVAYEFTGPLTNHAPLLLQLGLDGQWRSITTTRSANSARVCGQTTTLTMFVVAADNGRPSADTASISLREAGAAKGGGWYESGKSTGRYRGRKMFFEIAARHDNRGDVARGSRFILRADGLRFEASQIDSMVVSGSQANVMGTGRVERSRTSYRFLVTLLDGRGRSRVDRVRVRIWKAATGAVLYDSQPGAADDAAPTTRLGGGGVELTHRR